MTAEVDHESSTVFSRHRVVELFERKVVVAPLVDLVFEDEFGGERRRQLSLMRSSLRGLSVGELIIEQFSQKTTSSKTAFKTPVKYF